MMSHDLHASLNLRSLLETATCRTLMAFPVPEHLPRKPIPSDVSSQVLERISETSNRDLTSELVTGWISELQLGIEQTEVC